MAAIVHDAGLRNDDAFIATATSYALMTLDNQRLSAQARALLREVSDSRARIQATADDERRRIERDLHDGAQQRLVALRIKLELVAEEADGEDAERAATLRRLGSGGRGGDRRGALAGARDLPGGARRPRPRRGAALGGAAARRCRPRCWRPGVGRYSREIETTAYFCCLEALQNAAKHAHGASAAVIDLSDTGTLRSRCATTAPASTPRTIRPGAGFVNMRDRLSAVGGRARDGLEPGQGRADRRHDPAGGAAV